MITQLRWALADSWTVAWRDLIYWLREPAMIIWGLSFPIVMVLMYGYVFGGAMQVPGGDYQQFLMPGLFAMTMMFGMGNTMISVATDSAKGVTDRFRSMPMSPAGWVGGRSIADLINSVINLIVMIGCGLVIGWRWQGGPAGALGAVGLLLLLRLAFIWTGVYLGLIVGSPETASNFYALLFPLTVIANTVAPPGLMPGWLGAVAEWNPLSSTAAAARELFGSGGYGGESWVSQHPMLMALVWPLTLLAIFVPLSIRRFRALSR